MISLTFLLAAAAHAAPARVDTIYEPRGMVTLVTGNDDPDAHRGSPRLAFRDADGSPVRVYADHAVTLAQARDDLARSRKARAIAAAARRRLNDERL